ncbi:MAG TPA: flavin monoamine oxidase family protein [Solirubrobacteraceae bacterium]|nr:flavin monoamine oxidase family protein [Solirubrobacteraceae bacterium]
MSSENLQADVAIVGAGLSGLSAARALQAAGMRVVVLEARARVGGRILNESIAENVVVEVGAQWAGPGQRRLIALADELGVRRFPTYNTGQNLFELNGRLSRYRGLIPHINPAALLDMGQAQLRLERMSKQVPLEHPWRAEKAAAWDGQTFWTWIQRNLATRAGRATMQLATEAVWAAHPADLSLLHVLYYAHSAGGLQTLISVDGGAQAERFEGGSQLLPVRMAEALGDAVVLGAPVRRIHQDQAGVRLTGDDLEVEARRVIVACAPALAGRLVYDPPLPAARDGLTQRFCQGNAIKCMAWYPEPFWRADGLTGQANSDRGPVKVTFDNSPPGGTPGVLLGFLEGHQARELGAASAQTRRQAVLDCFARYFGPRAASPEGYVEKIWADEEYTRGCYAGYMPPNGWTDFGHALRAPVGRVYWAGAETAVEWNGYMDGAITAGERAAREVLAAE